MDEITEDEAIKIRFNNRSYKKIAIFSITMTVLFTIFLSIMTAICFIHNENNAFCYTMFVCFILLLLIMCRTSYRAFKLMYKNYMKLYGVRKIAYKSDLLLEYDKSCCICLGKYIERESLFVLPCKHTIHYECGRVWLITALTCPMCRKEIKYEFV